MQENSFFTAGSLGDRIVKPEGKCALKEISSTDGQLGYSIGDAIGCMAYSYSEAVKHQPVRVEMYGMYDMQHWKAGWEGMSLI